MLPRCLLVPLVAFAAVAGPGTRPVGAGQPLSPTGTLSMQAGGSAASAAFTAVVGPAVRGVGFRCIRSAMPVCGSADARGGFHSTAARGAGFSGSDRPLGQGEAFLSSLLLPGLSQYRQGKRRWIAYLGVEVLFAGLYLDARADTRELRTAYRDFAWTRARLGFSEQPRRDGDFEYYERLSKWAASGAWDADPRRDGLQPEPDRSTYNGSIWALAGEIFNLDPSNPEGSAGYARALEYYRERGYGPSLLWGWQGGSGDQDEFRNLIRDSDRRARDARLGLWIVTANHLLSAIDGFVTARLAASPQAGAPSLVVTFPVP